MADLNLEAIRMRFFKDLSSNDHIRIFRVFGIEQDLLLEVRTSADERRLFDHLFAARSAVPAQGEHSGRVAVNAARYEYLRATTKAIRNDEGTERIECTPEQFDAAVDAGRARAAAHKAQQEQP